MPCPSRPTFHLLSCACRGKEQWVPVEATDADPRPGPQCRWVSAIEEELRAAASPVPVQPGLPLLTHEHWECPQIVGAPSNEPTAPRRRRRREKIGLARSGTFRLCARQSSVIRLSPQSILATALTQSSRVALSEWGPGWCHPHPVGSLCRAGDVLVALALCLAEGSSHRGILRSTCKGYLYVTPCGVLNSERSAMASLPSPHCLPLTRKTSCPLAPL